ncbi:MAG: carboxymuconolactone decarboxylase family protein [Candidatus Eisenbacteria bacterium]
MPRPPRSASPAPAARRRRVLADLAARAVIPGTALGGRLARARAARIPRRALVELGLMLPLYAGFPAAIEFLRALAAVPFAAAPRTIGARPASNGRRAIRARGERLCARVYGPDYPRLRSFMRALAPEIDDWMIEDGYGRTLSRPGLSVVERELVTVAALAALGWERQLTAHRAGALRVGAQAAEVRAAERAGRARARA